MDETTSKIKHFIVDDFMPDVPADDLDDDFDLLTGGVVDSLGLLKVVAWLEDEFDIEISDRDAETLKTVGDVIALVKKKF